MLKRYSQYFAALILFLTTPFVSNLKAQNVDKSSRPSFSVFTLSLNENNRLKSSDLNLEKSSLSDRAFIDLTGDLSMSDLGLDAQTAYANGKDASAGYNVSAISIALEAYLTKTQLGQKIIAYQFDIKDDFVWKYDRLAQRGLESQTVREAQQALAAERGSIGTASSAFLETLTRTYVLFKLIDITELDTEDLFGNKKKVYNANKNVFLFKLNYNTKEEVLTDLGGLFCGEAPCGEKKDRFNQHTVPLKLVSTASSNLVKGTTSGSDIKDPAYLDMVVVNAYELAAQNVESLQVRTYVSDAKPISAMIGSKEGLRKGKRYQAVRQSLNENDEIIDKYRGYVRGSVVTNNKVNVTQIDSTGKEYVVQFAPSKFVQVHGFRIDKGDVLVEDSDFGALVNFYGAFGAFASIGAELNYMVPNTVGAYIGLVGDLSFQDEEKTSSFFRNYARRNPNGARSMFLQVGAGVAKDLYIAKGNFRLTPKASAIYNMAFFVSDDANATDYLDEVSLNNWGAKLGADFAIQFSEKFGLFGGLQYTYLTDVFTFEENGQEIGPGEGYKDYFSNYGTQLKLGFRVSF
jgi:hypothetical protein